MKAKSLFMCMVLAMPLGFTACSNDTEEVLEPEVQNTVKGTDTRDVDDGTYWWLWSKSQKIHFTYLDTKAWIYYHPSNKEVIIQKLAERGLELVEEVSNFSLGFYPPIYTNIGENAYFYAECEWNEVAASYKDIIDIPEILDACPNIQLEEGTKEECRGTSAIYVYTVSNEVLQEIAEEYKVHIVGTEDEILKISYVICDKNSKGNAFEICRDLWGKNHIGAEPALGVEAL